MASRWINACKGERIDNKERRRDGWQPWSGPADGAQVRLGQCGSKTSVKPRCNAASAGAMPQHHGGVRWHASVAWRCGRAGSSGRQAHANTNNAGSHSCTSASWPLARPWCCVGVAARPQAMAGCRQLMAGARHAPRARHGRCRRPRAASPASTHVLRTTCGRERRTTTHLESFLRPAIMQEKERRRRRRKGEERKEEEEEGEQGQDKTSKKSHSEAALILQSNESGRTRIIGKQSFLIGSKNHVLDKIEVLMDSSHSKKNVELGEYKSNKPKCLMTTSKNVLEKEKKNVTKERKMKKKKKKRRLKRRTRELRRRLRVRPGTAWLRAASHLLSLSIYLSLSLPPPATQAPPTLSSTSLPSSSLVAARPARVCEHGCPQRPRPQRRPPPRRSRYTVHAPVHAPPPRRARRVPAVARSSSGRPLRDVGGLMAVSLHVFLYAIDSFIRSFIHSFVHSFIH